MPRGDISLFTSILGRPEFFHQPSKPDLLAIDHCKKFIDRYYKEKLQQSGDGDKKSNDEDEPEEDNDEEYEKILKGWHVIKVCIYIYMRMCNTYYY